MLLAAAEVVGPLERMFGSVEDVGPMIAMGIPVIGAVLITLLDKRPNLREAVTIVCGLLLLQTVVSMFDLAQAWGTPEGTPTTHRIEAIQVVPGMPLAFHIEPLGMIYALIASSLWLLNSFYGIGYMRAHTEPHQTRFFACFALAISSAMGIAFSANMFTLFVFYEALTLSTFPLVAHYGTPEVRKSAHTYLGVLVVTSVGLLLVGVVGTYVATGTLDFTPGGVFRALGDEARPEMIATLFFLYIYGIGKAAVMPVHRWLPAAMLAPTPVSAFLHAVAVVKAGVFAVLKVTVYIFGVDTLTNVAIAIGNNWLVVMASFTILASSGIALYQDNLKRRLAYSTVSQLSYIVLGAALLTRDSITGGALHMVMHAFGKITLFFCAGAIYVATHKKNISEMRGLGRKMPLTFLAFLLASLSIIGLPPFGGAWSKWWLIMGSIDAGQQWVIIVLIISSLLNIAYLLPVAVDAFWYPAPDAPNGHEGHADDHHDDEHDEHDEHHQPFFLERFGLQEAPALCVIPLLITAIGTIVLFVYPDPFLDLTQAIRLR
jgi:multicomponent Na+:H+ antiporter subunit D